MKSQKESFNWQHWPQTWYVIARSSQIRVGDIRTGHLGGLSWIVYRAYSGRLYALNAFCPHMGAHLQSARVVGEVLECGLHACQIYPQETINQQIELSVDSRSLPAKSWPCHEYFGLIWLHPPTKTPPPLPFIDEDSAYDWIGAGPQRINADWRAMICNGFDLAHMKVVHQRQVVGQPKFIYLADGSLQMIYQTQVLQRGGLSSWFTKKLAGGNLYLTHTCNGSNIMVQSKVGRFQSIGIFALLPQNAPNTHADNAPEYRHTFAFAAVGLPKNTRFSWLKLHLARWLYLSFLKKDFIVVEGMRMQLADIKDIGVQAVVAYQNTLTAITDNQEET